MTKEKESISLKWGTLKSWDLKTEASVAAAQKYADLGMSMSAMMQHDTPEQKEALCELIDILDGTIYLDWDGKYVTKEEAKEYVLNYSR